MYEKGYPRTPQDLLAQVEPLPPEQMQRLKAEAKQAAEKAFEQFGASLLLGHTPSGQTKLIRDHALDLETLMLTIWDEANAQSWRPVPHAQYVTSKSWAEIKDKTISELRRLRGAYNALSTWVELKESTTCRCHVDPDNCANHAADVELYNAFHEASKR